MISQTFGGLMDDLGVRIKLEEKRSGFDTKYCVVNTWKMQMRLVLFDAQRTIQVTP